MKNMFIRAKSKRALSVMIGYILLVTFAMVIGVLVYTWMKTYVPKDELNCPDGNSLYINSYDYDCANELLSFELKNNGQFNLGGYFIYASNAEGIALENIDLTSNYTGPGFRLDPIGIKFDGTGEQPNTFLPGKSVTENYDLEGTGQIYSIRIVPIKWIKNEQSQSILTSCTNGIIRIELECAAAQCVDDGSACAGRECGTVLNNCYEYVPCGPACPGDEVCNSTGQCVAKTLCTSCENLGWECGSNCGTDDCGICPAWSHADVECAAGNCRIIGCETGWYDCDGDEENGCESDEECTGGGIPNSCPGVCYSLGYSSGQCSQNQNLCDTSCGGTGVFESEGDTWCTPPPIPPNCCCCP